MSKTDRRDRAAPTGRQPPVIIRLCDRLSRMFAFGAAAALVLLVLNVVVDVVGRTFFKSPFAGTLEMTAYWWMPMLTLLAFAFTEQRQDHIKVTILLEALPLRMRQIVEGSFGILTTGLLIGLTYFTAIEAIKSAEFRQTTASTPPLVIWPFKFVAVAGVGMLSLQALATTFRYFARLLPRRDAFDSEADLA